LNEEFLKVNAKFLIEINDNGMGIKKENLSKLFLEFGKLDEHSKMNR
jgi:signal transduction histidine kinase